MPSTNNTIRYTYLQRNRSTTVAFTVGRCVASTKLCLKVDKSYNHVLLLEGTNALSLLSWAVGSFQSVGPFVQHLNPIVGLLVPSNNFLIFQPGGGQSYQSVSACQPNTRPLIHWDLVAGPRVGFPPKGWEPPAHISEGMPTWGQPNSLSLWPEDQYTKWRQHQAEQVAFTIVAGCCIVSISVDFVEKSLGVLTSSAREGTGEECSRCWQVR